MIMWVIVLLVELPVFTLFPEGEFGRYIKNYELVDCRILRLKRSKRSSYLHNKTQFDAEVRFKSFGTDFHLLLREDTEFKNVKIESSKQGSFLQEEVKSTVYDGIVKMETANSYVFGYFEENAFIGYITSSQNTYYVERASRFFPEFTQRNKIVVYRQQDLNISTNLSIKEAAEHLSLKDELNRIIERRLAEYLPKGINKTKNENEDYACLIEIVSDHTLYDFFKGKIEKLTSYMYLHGKYADYIFRRTDFDNDGKRDRIRIITDKIFIYKSKNDPNYPMAYSNDMNSLLKTFSLRTQNYCLSLCMSFKYSVKLVIGEAYKSSESSMGPPGGICQKPIPFNDYYRTIERSLNTAVITVQNDRDIVLPIAVSLLAVVHEFGHSFGSNHDNTEDVFCSPGGSQGFYLMHLETQRDLKPLSSFFSPCSRKSIAGTISARGECLKPHPAKCGNGVQEGDEDCDCGTEDLCWFLDKCCTPSDAKSPEKGCTFRKSKGFVCSPKENLCCLTNCDVNPDTNFLCINSDDKSCMVSYCDGQNASCPKASPAPDKFPCQRTSKSCSKGTCNSSVCLDNGLNDCTCDDSFECSVCCKKENKCLRASALGYFPTKGTEHFVLEGTPCKSKRYQCDGSGNCINPRNRNIKSKEKSYSFGWTVAGLVFAVFAVIIILGILGYFVKVYNQNNVNQ